MKIDLKKLVFVFIILLSIAFFYKTFAGYTIQGNNQVSDSPLGLTVQYAHQISQTINRWFDGMWIGEKSGLALLNLYTLYTKIFPIEIVQNMTYFSAVLLSLIFCYLFLRKINLEMLPSLFGSIVYSFSPVILSFIYAGHILVVSALSYVPMLFYFLTAAFQKAENDKIKKVLFLILSGITWGLMASDEIQRALYFSILASFYILYLIYIENGLKLRQLKNSNLKNIGLDLLKTMLIMAVLLFTFYSGLQPLLDSLKYRTAMQNKVSDVSGQAEAGWNFATSYSFDPAELIDSLAFGFHGKSSLDQENVYWGSKEFSTSSESLGFFVIIFGLLGGIAYFKKSGFVRFFIAGGLISLLLSFGKFWPGVPFFWLFNHLPFVSNFRAPSKFLSVTAFCFSVLAAFGLKYFIELLNDKSNNSEKILKMIEKILFVFIGAGLLSMLGVLMMSSDSTLFFNQKYNNANIATSITNNMIFALLRMNIYIALILAMVSISFRMKEFNLKKIMIPGAFILLLLFDLWNTGLYYVDKSYIKVNEFYKQDGVISFLKKESETETFRVITSFMIPNQNGVGNIPLTALRGQYLTFYFSFFDIQPMEVIASSGVMEDYNNFFINAMKGALPKPVQTMDDLINVNLPLLRLTGVKYIITDGYLYPGRQPVPIFQSLTNNINFTLAAVVNGYNGAQAVFAVKNYLPRIAFFENYIAVANNNEALRYLSSNQINFQNTIIIKAPVNSVNLTQNTFQPVKVLNYQTSCTKAELDAPKDGVILFNTKFNSGWKAYIDGRKTAVCEANYLQMGVFVSAGKHIVEFKYEPDGRPFWISFFTVLAGLAGGFLYALYFLIFKNKIKV